MDLNIFLPDFLNPDENQPLEGCIVRMPDNLISIYIMDYRYSDRHPAFRDRFHENTFICGEKLSKFDTSQSSIQAPACNNYVRLKGGERKITIEHLKIDGALWNLNVDFRNVTIIYYNFSSFLKSEDLILNKKPEYYENFQSFSDLNQFQILKYFISHYDKNEIRNESHPKYTAAIPNENIVINMFMSIFIFLSGYSNLFCNLCNSANYTRWIGSSIVRDRKISVKVGNLILASVVDLVCGMILLDWINRWSPTIVDKIFELIYIIIPNVQKLLIWLMGSPAGLKLNHAFNNILGKFFMYHIDLWWMFLEICRYALEIAIQIFQYLGMLGITFQAAILVDLLSLATFHVYCIYIYAARLYNIQLNGLIALWRLFLGRKHNPLRAGVDSCHYNHHQLFIGTLGFTVLLFLLPTTLMYYAVFTIFRITILTLGGFLKWIQIFIQSLPLHMLILWITKSKKIAGDVRISVLPNSNDNNAPMTLSVELRSASLLQLIDTYKPDPIPAPPKVKCSEIMTKLWRGDLLNSD